MTTGQLYLSRARLRTRRGEALASIAPLLLARAAGAAAANGHRIVWMLFQETPDLGGAGNWREAADGPGFLWRDEGDGRYLVLSRKRPTDPQGLFDLDEPKEFSPALSAGDRLRFVLRANPVVRIDQDETRTTAKGRVTPKRKKVDVVMHALRDVPATDWDAKSGRAFARDQLVTSTVSGWLDRQGERAGFCRAADAPFTAANYTQVQVERSGRGGRRPAGISMVDLAGEIVVTDPAAFLAKLPVGFGSAKAFGCGLMLIRRARAG
jgi:CRISPR system Cascade subunit CasE